MRPPKRIPPAEFASLSSLIKSFNWIALANNFLGIVVGNLLLPYDRLQNYPEGLNQKECYNIVSVQLGSVNIVAVESRLPSRVFSSSFMEISNPGHHNSKRIDADSIAQGLLKKCALLNYYERL